MVNIDFCPLTSEECLKTQPIAEEKLNHNKINVVFGYQFKSKYYNSDKLVDKLKEICMKAEEIINSNEKKKKQIKFRKLKGKIGRHTLCEICKNIQSSDIAFFEISDKNPNVCIELGLAIGTNTVIIPIK